MMAKKRSAGAELVAMRYAKQSPAERSEAARHAATKRWEGHKAKRPASARKKAQKR